jgi:hypothetical protein
MTTPEKRADLIATMELIHAEEADAYNWTAEELAIMRQGGSVPVVVNGAVFEARMPRDAKRQP